ARVSLLSPQSVLLFRTQPIGVEASCFQRSPCHAWGPRTPDCRRPSSRRVGVSSVAVGIALVPIGGGEVSGAYATSTCICVPPGCQGAGIARTSAAPAETRAGNQYR